jgi:hypothetical protein
MYGITDYLGRVATRRLVSDGIGNRKVVYDGPVLGHFDTLGKVVTACAQHLLPWRRLGNIDRPGFQTDT